MSPTFGLLIIAVAIIIFLSSGTCTADHRPPPKPYVRRSTVWPRDNNRMDRGMDRGMDRDMECVQRSLTQYNRSTPVGPQAHMLNYSSIVERDNGSELRELEIDDMIVSR